MQSSLLLLIASLVTAYAIALALYPLLCRRGRWTVAAIAFAIVAPIACTLLIPRQQVALRVVAALVSTDLMFRLIDFARQMRSDRSTCPNWLAYCRFLIPFPFLHVVFDLRSRRLVPGMRKGRELLRLACGGAIFGLALGLTLAAQSNSALRTSFLLDHAVKVLLIVVVIESASQFALGLERLAGFDPLPIVDRAFLARTPAEFWFRYNQRVRLWFTLNVFLPSGGRRAPIRGVITTFFASAVLHELAFGIATSRFDGYQAAFFLLQAPAVIVSRRLDRLASSNGLIGRTVVRGLAILWMAATSVLFLHGVDRVFPFFYASQPWLP